jgi:hypothetical protein
VSKKLENIQIQFQKRNARAKGPTSSRDYNDSIDELGHDLSSFRTQWNDRLVKFTANIPDGTGVATDINAFDTGLDGRTLYVHAEATLTSNTTYFNTTKNRPNSIWEQMVSIYGDISQLREDLENQISNNTLTASDIPIKDAASLYLAGNVEDALAEIGTKVDNLSGIGAGSLEQVAFFTSVGTVIGTSEFSWDNTSKQLNLDGDARVQHLRLQQRAVTPSGVAGQGKLYTKTDDLLYYMDAAGVEHALDIDTSDDFAYSGVTDELTFWTTASGVGSVTGSRFTGSKLFLSAGTTFHPSGVGTRSVAIGDGSQLTTGTDAIWITGDNLVGGESVGDQSIAIGNRSRAGGQNSVTIGYAGTNDADQSVVIGSSTGNLTWVPLGGVLIGYQAQALSNSDYFIAIGHGAGNGGRTNCDYGIAIGRMLLTSLD